MQVLTISEINAVEGAGLSCTLTTTPTNWAEVGAWGLAGLYGGIGGAIVSAGADYLSQSWNCHF